MAISRMVPEVLATADELSQLGIEPEVIDPGTLRLFDTHATVASVRKTRRIVIVPDDSPAGGIGSITWSEVRKEIFFPLEALHRS